MRQCVGAVEGCIEAGPSVKKGVKMVDMSTHDVSGVVGWCLGAYSEVENT